ncbi:MAG: glycoside hydrolase family 65 protein [Anaerolineae bacterium]|nr:glycoside hydrolase family 65 protein [Anaerolineae bacterium]
MTSTSYFSPEVRTWTVSEAPFHPGKQYHTETITTIGNGYMGLRGSFEEGYPNEIVSTLIHGVYNQAPEEIVPDLVNLPNPLAIQIMVDGEQFHMQKGSVLGFRRALDLKTALLTRGILWRNSKGSIVQITFERFASLEHEHVLAQRVTVRALWGDPEIEIAAAIDADRLSAGANHWQVLEKGHDGTASIHCTGTTNQSNYQIAVAATVQCDHGELVYEPLDNLTPALRAKFSLKQDQGASLVKLTAIHSNRDTADPLVAAKNTLNTASKIGYDELYNGHQAEWAKYWYDSDIEIDGDEIAQRALRFCLYHVLIAAPRHDDRVSIGAKTLSGPGYKGHVFWDTELFMLPPLTLTQPKIAKNLLMYRYHNLQGARNKAQEAGYEGAMFPWESTDTGEETTPRWTSPYPDTPRIRIWTGDNEQHISTDIAYATLQYWHWSGDEDFFVNCGAEIVLDTAVFWGSRVEYNRTLDRYELSQQIGPDEYHENVDNSAFTNSMVRWHLRQALQLVDWLKQTHPQKAEALLARLKIDAARLELWQRVIDKMYIPRDPQTGLYEQFDGFFKLHKVDLTHWTPKVHNMDAIMGHEPTQEMGFIKQADIVMLMALLGEDAGTLEQRQRNWDYYYPLCDHGSSLSPSTHAWVAARLGLDDEAYYMFMYAANIDLEDLKGNVRDGIHAAASGGLWEAAVWGFAGLTLDGDNYKFDPNLPKHWKSMKFRFWHKGKQHTVTLTAE